MHILRHRRKQVTGIWYFPFYPNLCVFGTGSLLKVLNLYECHTNGFYLALTDTCPMQFSGSIDFVKLIFFVKSLDYINQDIYTEAICLRTVRFETICSSLIWLLIAKQSYLTNHVNPSTFIFICLPCHELVSHSGLPGCLSSSPEDSWLPL